MASSDDEMSWTKADLAALRARAKGLISEEDEKELEEILLDPQFEEGCRPLFDRLARIYKLPYSHVQNPRFWMLGTQLQAAGEIFRGIKPKDDKAFAQDEEAGHEGAIEAERASKSFQQAHSEKIAMTDFDKEKNDKEEMGAQSERFGFEKRADAQGIEVKARAARIDSDGVDSDDIFEEDLLRRRAEQGIFEPMQAHDAAFDIEHLAGSDAKQNFFEQASHIDQTKPRQEKSFLDRMRRAANGFARLVRNRRERGELGRVTDQKAEKTKQRRNFLVLFAGILLFSLVVAYVSEKNAAPKAPVVKTYRNDFRLEPDSLDKQSFQRQYEEKLDDIGIKMKSMESLMSQLDARMKALAKEEHAKSAGEAKAFDSDGPQRVPLAELPPIGDEISLREEEARLMSSITVANSSDASAARMGVVRVSSGKKMESLYRGPRRIADQPIAANRARHERENTYLPAGSFARAVVLSGVTAPTGGNAAQNPMPLLLEIKEFAQLPNDFKANVRRCFVTANATGDLSSERVLVRLDRLSCMNKQGKAVDVRVQGYVTGEDGKAGVRARLVTRSGQAIASALFTGAISGLGKAVSLSAQSTTTYTSGAVGSNVENAWAAGLGEGVDDAMDRIVNYYLKLADKIFPVLELDSGRKVDVVLAQGLSISFEDSFPKEPEVLNHSQIFGDRQKSLRDGLAQSQ